MDEEKRGLLTLRKRELANQRRTVMQKLPGMVREYVQQMDAHLLNSNVSDAEETLRMMTKMLKRRRALLTQIDVRLKAIQEKLTA